LREVLYILSDDCENEVIMSANILHGKR
jgi:hypothetical protein